MKKKIIFTIAVLVGVLGLVAGGCAGEPEPTKPISVGPVYLDQAWVRLLPGLLLSGPQELHAVAIYSLETRTLLSHTIQPLGERRIEGHHGTAYAFEVREGFIGDPALLFCDERGSLLRLEAGDLVLKRVSAEEIERKYGRRRDETRQRLKLLDE